jgi:hypothetical protein
MKGRKFLDQLNDYQLLKTLLTVNNLKLTKRHQTNKGPEVGCRITTDHAHPLRHLVTSPGVHADFRLIQHTLLHCPEPHYSFKFLHTPGHEDDSSRSWLLVCYRRHWSVGPTARTKESGHVTWLPSATAFSPQSKTGTRDYRQTTFTTIYNNCCVS